MLIDCRRDFAVLHRLIEAIRILRPLLSITVGLSLAIFASNTSATDNRSAEMYVDCSAYFFMAANVKAMSEFNEYYSAGEFAYNTAVRLNGEDAALERFNTSTGSINKLIERNWLEFGKADTKYGVVCADILRDANRPN